MTINQTDVDTFVEQLEVEITRIPGTHSSVQEKNNIIAHAPKPRFSENILDLK